MEDGMAQKEAGFYLKFSDSGAFTRFCTLDVPYWQDVKNSDVLYAGVFICLGMIIQYCDIKIIISCQSTGKPKFPWIWLL